VIGHSHGELGHFAAHDPVYHGRDQSQMKSGEIRSDEMSDKKYR